MRGGYALLFSLIIACSGGEGETTVPGTTTDDTDVPTEIPGDGVDQDGDGWADEYGVGLSRRMAATFVGPFTSLATGSTGSTDYMAAALYDRDGSSFLYSWWSPIYGAPLTTAGPTDDASFASAMAIVDGFLVTSGAPEDHALRVYNLPASATLWLVPVDPGRGSRITGVQLALDGPTDVLTTTADGDTVLLRRAYFPAAPLDDGWTGAIGGAAADLDGDGVRELAVSDGSSVWIVPVDGGGVVDPAAVGVRLAAGGQGVSWGAPAGALDLDADGREELLVPGADDAGGSWIAAFDADGEVGRVTADYPGEACSAAAPVGAQVAIGCPGGEKLPGRVGVFLAEDLLGTHTMSEALATWVGLDPGEGFGRAVTGDADMTGDDVPDLAALGTDISVVGGPPIR